MGSNSWSGTRSFFDLYAHNFVRASICVPRVRLADPLGNAEAIAELYEKACAAGAALALFPELCICGYSLDDLLQQDTILEESLAALAELKRRTLAHPAVLVVGAPLRVEGRLYNCAIAFSRGKTLAIVPKLHLPNFREFYEARQFVSGDVKRGGKTFPGSFLGEADVPFRSDVILRCRENPSFSIGLEVCQDLWVPVPPSTFHAWRGATVLANLSASNITIGKAAYRHELVKTTSARLYAAYLYASAGQGESTNDLSWDGQAIAYEGGDLLGETERFDLSPEGQTLLVDVDLDRLEQDRMRDMTWAHNASQFAEKVDAVQVVDFSFDPAFFDAAVAVTSSEKKRWWPLAHRGVARRPYVPSEPASLKERCYECYSIQVAGLCQRMRASGVRKLVIGVSGGLDSTHALLVCCQAMDKLGLPRTHVLGYTMPGYATGDETKGYAIELMTRLGVSCETVDITASCDRMLCDLKHPYALGERAHSVYDVTFENVQAGERTNHLFRLANHLGALVVGTGDLSELALGWCTYGVGDHMSHYGLNASVPKSLIQCVIQWVISDGLMRSAKVDAVLRQILAVEISPELVPQEKGDDGQPLKLQSTEDAIGPYDLHDFQLYHTTRRGFSVSKCAFLACYAWADDFPRAQDARAAEPQPSLGGASVLEDRDFPVSKVLEFQRGFLRRFFLTSQFKRTCVPNAPKVGDGGSLSPRGDWRAPSDSSWAPWERAWNRTAEWARTSAAELADDALATRLATLLAATHKTA